MDDGSVLGAWALSGEVREAGFTRDAYMESAAYLLGRMLRADTITWDAVDVSTGRTEVYEPTATLDWRKFEAEALGQVVADHPMIVSYLDPATQCGGTPRRMSDIVTKSELSRTVAYNELLRRIGAEYQLTVLTAFSGSQRATGGRCWTLNRSARDFTEEDRASLERLQPVLVALDKACRDAQAQPDAGAVSPIEAASRFGVTARELEVLQLLARGLTGEAIGRALAISVGTVRKHLENIYRKLDANDRLVAVTQAQAWGLLAPT